MSQPPIVQTPIFNPTFFSAYSDALTIEKADQRYLSLGGGFIGGNLSINGALMVGGQEVVPPPAYVLGITPGTAENNKALVVDSNKDIGSIRNLSCTGTFTASTSIPTPWLTTDTITKAGTQTMSATTLNINPTTLQIRGTTLTATATELNALSGLTATSTELNYSDITTL